MWTHLWLRPRIRAQRRARDPNRTRLRRRLHLEPLEARCLLSGNVVVRWNELLLDAAQHAPPSRVPVTRNLALASVAMFDAVNAIARAYTPYYAHVHASRGASEDAAVAQAAHDTAGALYPYRQDVFDAALASDLSGIAPGLARQGIEIGQAVAQQILDLRSNDGAGALVTYTPPNQDPGQWQPTPPDFTPATNAQFPSITPFAVLSSSQFRAPPPPALDSPEYAAGFNEVKAIGSRNSAVRTADQTQVGLIWRLPLTNVQVWNRIAQDMASTHGLTVEQTARLFALLDMAQNDALENSFESKYHYTLWRPITAIRRADEDGNAATEADPTWTTLHPTTPAFPTYPSNAGAEGGSSATVLADFFGTDHIPFQVQWDAYGFPGVTRSYAGFWAAADEEGRSRVYGGIHFPFDIGPGQDIGRQVADYAFNHVLLSVPSEDEQDDLTSAASQAAVSSGVAGNSALLAGALTPSPAPSIAAGAALAPTRSGNRQPVPLAAALSSGSTGQRFDGPTHRLAASNDVDAVFADLGRDPVAEGP